MSLAAVLEAKDMSVRALAQRIGINAECIRLWNVGKRPIPANRVEALCKELACRPADLVPVEPEPVFRPFRYSPTVWATGDPCWICSHEPCCCHRRAA